MRPLTTVSIFIGLVLTLGALLAPWVYWGAQSGSETPLLVSFARQPFHRFVSRCLLLVAFVGIWPLVRALQIQSNELGLRPSSRQMKQFLQGFVLGFITLAGIAVLAVLFDARRWNGELTWQRLSSKLGEATLTAAIVATTEEILYRGALFGGLRRQFGWIKALLLSSAIYAWFHFLKRPESPEVVHWYSGFIVLGKMLRGFVEIESLIPGFFVLFFAGAILAFAFQKTKALWLPIGIHAGWVFWLRLYGTLTLPAPESNRSLWGSSNITDGWAAAVALFLLALCLQRNLRTAAKYDVESA